MTDVLKDGRLADATRWLKQMRLLLFAFGDSPVSYVLDFFFYALLIIFLIGFTIGDIYATPWVLLVVLAGGFGWTLIEYLLHRHVLHGIQPFQRWHESHHYHPRALMSTATMLSMSLFVLLVFVPVRLLSGSHHAAQFLLGILAGYFLYSLSHHAAHHWRGRAPLAGRRKRWHAMHHQSALPVCFGVTTQLWDYVFGTAVPRKKSQ